MVNNRIEYDIICSDLVYPDWTNKELYTIVGKLDKDYVEESLLHHFGTSFIANKYAIQMPNGLLWYKHDFHVYALIKK